MDGTPYVIGSHMGALTDCLESVATNIANADTPGYRGVAPRFSSILQGFGAAPLSVGAEVRPQYVRLDTAGHMLAQGPIERTGRPLDVAVKGTAFLAVATADGERYTRKGRLYVSPTGELTDAEGNPFVGKGGAMNVPPEASDVTISPDGEVWADDQSVGTLKLVDIPEPDRMLAEGWGLYRNQGLPARPAVGSELIQGAVEGSNVSIVKELVLLIEVTRAYEASARVLKRLDGLTGQLVRSAGAS